MPTPQFSQQLFDPAGVHFDNGRVFYAYFAKMPNVFRVDDIDEPKFIRWFTGHHAANIIAEHSKKSWGKKKFEIDDLIWILQTELLINIGNGSVYILYAPEAGPTALKLFDAVKKFRTRSKPRPEIRVIVSGSHELETKGLRLSRPSLQLNEQYNDDLVCLHPRIVRLLRKKNESGLLLFHGLPGTGKSTYIRYLIHHVPKKVLFLTPALAASLDSPAMCRLLVKNDNSILVIEDAEQLVTSRADKRNSSISMLLNVTDGLLGASLGIQVIATFNTELYHIDPALMRKGRLHLRYEFKALTADKSLRLLQKRGVRNPAMSGAMTLADIYHAEKESFAIRQTKRPAIGFRTNN